MLASFDLGAVVDVGVVIAFDVFISKVELTCCALCGIYA